MSGLASVLLLSVITASFHSEHATNDVNAGMSQANCLTGILFKGVDKRMDELELKITLLTKRVVHLTNQVHPVAPITKRAFTVNLKRSLHKLGPSQTIIFDNVVYNPDGAYDIKSGIYQCPVDGVYLFHVSIMAHVSASSVFAVQMMKSGVVVADIYERGIHGGTADLAIVPCRKNEKVWIKIRFDYHNIDIYGDSFSSFSGVMLY